MKSNYSNAFFVRKNVWIIVFSFLIFLLFAFQTSTKDTGTSQKFKTLQLSEVLYRNCCNRVSIPSYGVKDYNSIELSCNNAELIQDSTKKDCFTIIPKSGNKVVIEIKSKKMLIGTVEWRVVAFEPKIKWFYDTSEVKNRVIVTKNRWSSIRLRIELPPNMDNRENQITVNANCSFKPSALSNWTDYDKCISLSPGGSNNLFVNPYLTNTGSAYYVRITDMYLTNCKNQKVSLPIPKAPENSVVVVLQ